MEEPGPDVEAVVPEDGPTRLSGALAVAAAAATAVLAGQTSGVALAVGLLGVALVAGGLTVDVARYVGYGAIAAFGAAMAAGAAGADPIPVVAATLGAVASWDLGEQALALGEQVGRDAPTASAELGHAAVTLAVGLAAAVGVLAVYRLGTVGLTTTAVVALSLAALLLAGALRH